MDGQQQPQRTKNNVIQSAERKLQKGLITQAEFNVITDCDLLASFDEEGLLQSPGALVTPADEARQKLASGMITLQEARSIIDNHLTGSNEDATHMTHVLDQWRQESSNPSTSWHSWIYKNTSEESSMPTDGDDPDIIPRESSLSMFSIRSQSAESVELSQSPLDPRVEVCIVVYSDAICAYNDMQAEADKSKKEDQIRKQEIENKLEEHRTTRRKFLERRSSNDDEGWYIGKNLKRLTLTLTKSTSTPLVPSSSSSSSSIEEKRRQSHESSLVTRSVSTNSSANSSMDEEEAEAKACIWRSVARELLQFEEEASARAQSYALKISSLKASVDQSFAELEALSLELHEQKNGAPSSNLSDTEPLEPPPSSVFVSLTSEIEAEEVQSSVDPLVPVPSSSSEIEAEEVQSSVDPLVPVPSSSSEIEAEEVQSSV
eukprot:CAMPEP_0114380650 /NCGR_PEP_ID=MMETSP0102-20121206/2991_1 /TAXON_ID=38822 ORGANISM="Pteridomonas danica, Strain PT" /NCGR_SAMPLE_ID=MMETSP0102 /ASSEMBLY_ACC=CAM_ASM_000212 /LENGTH=431 /DNA_ID=CAMNT_0001536003 /DNA_START=163 /DNA_END=1455 /DNA_ORIENTATION=+